MRDGEAESFREASPLGRSVALKCDGCKSLSSARGCLSITPDLILFFFSFTFIYAYLLNIKNLLHK
ncbi:hypothetical protein H1P_510005 [Hyella patelloides LEGE 07179]|uniref:Uncharacterized protein n=1 Tax=Hyella patelloides LEGE 07179 TaxID=945734 RepID=A0A563VZL0_9CYAN|nr:hypothetical protein H1P_510005 [Hyella patelloides LEGE 07179]